MHYRLTRLISCALLAGASSIAVAAPDSGWYIGAGVGSAKSKLQGIRDDVSQKNSATGYKLYGGYKFSPHFSTELEYLHLGSWRGAYDQGQGNATVRASALAMSAVGMLPLGEQFALFGKLGVASKFANFKDERQDGSYKYARKSVTATYLLGTGVQWQFSPSMALRAEYQLLGRTSVDEQTLKLDNSLITLGLQYKF